MTERQILFSAPMVRAILAGTKTQTRRIVKPQPPDECTHTGPVMGTYSGVPVPRFYWQTAEDYDRAEEQDKEFVYWPAADDEESDGFTGDVYGLGGLECPYGTEANCMKAADRLWVRETWAPQVDCELSAERWTRGINCSGPKPIVHFAADDRRSVKPWVTKWRPSIHMPRWACRLELEITGVRVERLRTISEADALAEGIVQLKDGGYGLPAGEHYHSADPRQSYLSLWEAINGPGSVEANPWVWCVEFARVA